MRGESKGLDTEDPQHVVIAAGALERNQSQAEYRGSVGTSII